MNNLPEPQSIVNIKGWITTGASTQSHYQATLQDGRILPLSREAFNATLAAIRQDPRFTLSEVVCAELGRSYNIRQLQPVATPTPAATCYSQLATRNSQLEDYIIRSHSARNDNRSPITGHFRGGDRGGK